jgi:signal transduction histidine kinase
LLNVLIVEDSPDDAAIMVSELERSGFELQWQRVDTEGPYRAALNEAVDVILSDYTLPQFSQERALALLQESGADIPFIVVSGTIGEERAVACLKAGATDYVLKDRLRRLGPAVQRALDEHRERVRRRAAETQLRVVQEQFARAQRMESIGALAGGVAHDLNNVLAPILLTCELLKMEAHDPDHQRLIATIKSSAERGAELVRQVLSFARGAEGRRLYMEPHHLVREIVNIACQTFPKSIHVRARIPNDIWTLAGDPTQIHQVLLNLCVNARDAMPRGGDLTLTVENVPAAAAAPLAAGAAHAGPYVVIKVQDSGEGIPPGILDKIFEPFFTTKPEGKGTGLGLATSLAIVKNHGGAITVQSEPGRGATFAVWLPAQTGEEPMAPAPLDRHLPRGHGELIMVVDDEAFVRAITKQTLEAYGYSVLTAPNGVDALSVYAQSQHDLDLVFTDMMMPLMDGASLMLALRQINPQVRIIAVSGLTTPDHQREAMDAGATLFLPKPFAIEHLLNTLAETLRRN